MATDFVKGVRLRTACTQHCSSATLPMLSEIEIPKAWYGLAFSQDGKTLYASGGNDNLIAIYKIENQQLARDGEIVLGKTWAEGTRICPTGLALDEANQRLFAATKEDNSLYVCNLQSRKVEQKISLAGEAYAVLVSPKQNEVYVSMWGAQKVLIFDKYN